MLSLRMRVDEAAAQKKKLVLIMLQISSGFPMAESR